MDFEQVYRKYFNDVFLYISRLSGDLHIAEEITSETFLKALTSINKFRGECDVRVWLFQIAKNTYYTYRWEQWVYIRRILSGSNRYKWGVCFRKLGHSFFVGNRKE